MRIILPLTFVLGFFFRFISAQKSNNSVNKNWIPQNGDVYLQEVSVKIATDKPVISIAETGGTSLLL